MLTYFRTSKLFKVVLLSTTALSHSLPYTAEASGRGEPGQEREMNRTPVSGRLSGNVRKAEEAFSSQSPDKKQTVSNPGSQSGIERESQGYGVTSNSIEGSDRQGPAAAPAAAASAATVTPMEGIEPTGDGSLVAIQKQDTKLQDLHDEVLGHIASFLPLSNIAQFGRTCHQLKSAVLNDENAPYWGHLRVEGLTFKQSLKLLYEVTDYCSSDQDLSNFVNSTLRSLNLNPIDFLQLASNQGQRDAQCALGDCYRVGRGVPQNLQRAVELYTQAAEQGHIEAQYQLGNCYGVGRGVPQDLQRAVELYTQAAEQGHKDAQYNLAIFYNQNEEYGDIEKAKYWYTQAAEQGHDEAQYRLGSAYQDGDFGERNMEKAFYWYTQSAEQGYEEAQYILGMCYEEGKGVSKDLNKALYWYTQAAEQGHISARLASMELLSGSISQ